MPSQRSSYEKVTWNSSYGVFTMYIPPHLLLVEMHFVLCTRNNHVFHLNISIPECVWNIAEGWSRRSLELAELTAEDKTSV